MAEIKPFAPIRYTALAGEIEKLVCPPYDIVSDAGYASLVAENRHNLIRLELPHGDYAGAGKLLDEWMADGILAKDESESFFLYTEEFVHAGKQYTLTGIVCRTKLTDFSEGIVLPHEETLSKAKADRFALMEATFCNFSSVYALYDGDDSIKSVVERGAKEAPLNRFTDSEGVTHTLRRIGGCEGLEKAFAAKKLFIADGHHRYETACKFHREQLAKGNTDASHGYVLMTLVCFDDPGLVVLPTHRVIVGMQVDKKELLEKCANDFDIAEYPDVADAEKILEANSDRHSYALYCGGDGFTLLSAKDSACVRFENRSEAYSELDVTVLHEQILAKAMGIDRKNMEQQINLRYTRSAAEAVASVRSGEAGCAFIINPTRVEQIRAVALAGDRMPQKSTYFYPKLISGLFINPLKG